MTLQEQAELALWIVEYDPNPIGYDVETSGLDWKRNSIVGYVITGSKTLIEHEGIDRPEGLHSIYVPIRHGGGGNLWSVGVEPMRCPTDGTVEHWFETKLALAFAARRRKGYLIVGHNIGFDALFSWKHNILLGRNMRDTQHQATMLDEHQDSFSLERTAIVFGATPKLGQGLYQHMSNLGFGPAKKGIMEHYWRTSGSDPIVSDYAAGDGITTLEVYYKQLPYIKEEKLERIVLIENELIWTLVRMERRGWKIAVDRFEEIIGKVCTMLTEARNALPYGFNVRSQAAVRALAERSGHTDWPTTAPSDRFPNGQPSFTEGYLETFTEGKMVLRVRKLEKILSSFILPLRDQHTWRGRVHGHLNQLKADEYGTISGRLSASNPNLQQVPARDEELATLLRLLFIADEGMVIYEGDYSQQEPRLWAHYSHDKYLNDGYNASPPRDVHTVTGDLIGVIRKVAKNINLGLFYLMGKKTFHKHMSKFQPGITRAETDALHDKWYANFTDIRRFQNEATNVFKSRGWVRTILGRRARSDGSTRYYVAPNRIIQGGAADITKERMLFIDKAFEAAGDVSYLITTIHDSIIWQSPKDDTVTPAWVKATMEDLNGEPYNLTVPFVVDMTKGDNWSAVKFSKEEV